VIAASNHIAETGQGPVNDSHFQICFYQSGIKMQDQFKNQK
jgi:hypothetical protein